MEATVESIETAMEAIAKTRMHASEAATIASTEAAMHAAATTMAPAATLRKDREADQKRDAYN